MSRHAFDYIAGAGGLAVRHVFATGHQAHHIQRQLHQRDGFHGAEHAAGAAHVIFHLVHVRCGFQRNAAGVEGDAFADQHHGLGAFLATVVLHDDELRRIAAAKGNRQQRTHAQFFHFLLLEDIDFNAVLFHQRARRVGKISRRADIRRRVSQIFRKGNTRGDGVAGTQRCVDGRLLGFARDVKANLLQCGGIFFRRAFVAVEAILRFHGQQHGLLGFPSGITLGDGNFQQVQSSAIGAGLGEGADRGANRFAIGFVAQR